MCSYSANLCTLISVKVKEEKVLNPLEPYICVETTYLVVEKGQICFYLPLKPS